MQRAIGALNEAFIVSSLIFAMVGVTMVATLHVINSMVVIAAKRHVGTGATTNAELAVTIAKTRNFPFGS